MKIHYRRNSFPPLAAALALLVNHASAATGTWNVDANGFWGTAGNWTPGIADDLLSTANFTNNITADRTVSLDSDRTINRVNFSDSDTSSAGSWILDNNGSATNNLILSGTTGAASGTVPVIDVGALGAGKTATISAVIEGTYGFSKTSNGTLILTGDNTLSGSVNILNGGKLIAGHNNAFGTATVTINNSGSTLELADGITLNNAITIAAQGNAKGIRSGSGIAAITGNITLTEDVVGNAEIRASAGGTLTLSGDISGNGFEKLDPGTVILTGTNTYTGGTQVNGGIVDFANKAAKPATGTVTANASGSVGLGVKASDAAYYSATDVGDLFNTNTLTGFSLNAASGVAIDTTNAGADFDQTVALTAARALTKLGTGTLILSQTNTYTGATNVNAGTLSLGHATNTLANTGAVNVNGGILALGANTDTVGSVTLASGSITGSGTLTAATYSLTGGTLAAQLGAGAVTVNGAVTFSAAGRLNASSSLIIQGGTLTLTGDETVASFQQTGGTIAGAFGINSASGFDLQSGTISGNMGGTGGLTKTGVGTTVITGNNTYTGATNVTAGTLRVNGTTAAGSTVAVSAGATLGGTGTIGGIVNVSGVLSPGASIETLNTGTLSLTNGSSLVHELNSGVATAVGSDLLLVTGNLNLAGTVGLTLSDLASPTVVFNVNDVFSIINYTGTWNGGLFTFGGNELANAEEFSFGLNTWRINYNALTGGLNFANEYVSGSFVNLTVIPEPDIAALIGAFGAILLLRRRR